MSGLSVGLLIRMIRDLYTDLCRLVFMSICFRPYTDRQSNVSLWHLLKWPCAYLKSRSHARGSGSGGPGHRCARPGRILHNVRVDGLEPMDLASDGC